MAATGEDPSALGPRARAEALDTIGRTPLDLIVIGGGVTGAGTALDAALRGLRVALFEQRDLASGTSSRSSKLIHGGLRYLEQLDLKLVFEALQERGLFLQRLCPHLVRPVSFVYPLRHRFWERPYVGAGVFLYDLFASRGDNPLPRHRHLGRRSALELVPALDPDSLVGAIRYWDAQVDDARHTLAVARTAAGLGARILTRTQVTGLLRDGDGVHGVEIECLETGRRIAVDATVVVSAAGVWTDEIEDMAGNRPIRVRASKGVHIVVPRSAIEMDEPDTGLIVRTEKSILLVILWEDDHWIIGTTDTPWDEEVDHPAATRSDIDYLLDRVNQILRRPVRHEDIVGVYVGVRPLVETEDADTTDVSREHVVARPRPGLVTVAGGKYTTYRVMAADAVDAASELIEGELPPSSTDDFPLIGAAGYESLLASRADLARRYGLGTDAVEHLLSRHGDRIEEVLAPTGERPELLEPITCGEPYLRAEVVYAVTHEAALHLEDVLTRRTRLSIETSDRGLGAAPEVAGLMAAELRWDAVTAEAELRAYRERVAAERASQEVVDDSTASQVRNLAPEVRPVR